MIANIFRAIDTALLILGTYNERQYVNFYSNLSQLVENLKNQEINTLSKSLRGDVCLVVEKNCNYGIFDSLLKDDKPVGLYFQNTGFNIYDLYKSTSYTYYILSPYIPASENHKCFYYTLKMAGLLNRDILGVFYEIFGTIYYWYQNNKMIKLLTSKTTVLKYKGFSYEAFEDKYFTFYKFGCGDIGDILLTTYKIPNNILIELSVIMNTLRGKDKAKVSKADWCTSAVESILEMLLKHKILKSTVDVEEYPEIIPLLFPCKFVDTDKYFWSYSDLVTLCLDLRRVLDSELSFLFNADVVRECLSLGGFYAITEEY